jgi:glycosyltransferase involved in cell wall biosynthesis
MLIALVGTELCSVTTSEGGLESVVRTWGAALSERHDVVLIDAGPARAGDRLLTDLPWRSVSSADELRNVLDGLDPDVVQLNNRPLWEIGERRRVLTLHNFPPVPGPTPDHGWGVALPRDSPSLRARFRQHRTTAVSDALAARIRRFAGTTSHRIGTTYPLVEPVFGEVRHVGGSGVLFPNRLMHKKGVELFLDAIEDPRLQALPVRMHDYTSPFLREDRDFLYLRDRITKSRAVLAPAPRTRLELAHAYAGADVVVTLALEPEGFGLVPLEAQFVGTPVVTAGRGGLREANLDPELHVRLAKDSIVDAILRAIRRTRPVAMSALDRQRFSTASIVDSLEAALR